MTSSASGPSRLLVGCCCVTFISVLFFTAGFVRLELELRAQRDRIFSLEKNQETSKTATDSPFLNKGNSKLPFQLRPFIILIEFGNTEKDNGFPIKNRRTKSFLLSKPDLNYVDLQLHLKHITSASAQ